VSLEASVRAIHGRVLTRRLVLGVSRGLLLGLAPSAVLLAIHPFAPIPYALVLVMVLPILGGFGGLLWYWFSRPVLGGTVHELDRHLKSYDRFTTAYECAQQGPRNSVEEELVRTTERAAGRLQPGILVPRGLPRETKAAVGLAAFVLMGLVALVPRGDALKRMARDAVVDRQVRKIEKMLEKAAKDGRKIDPELAKKLSGLMNDVKDAKSLDDVFKTAREALAEIERAAAKSGDPAALAAARKLGRVAEYLTRSRTARELAEALEKGDLQRAARLGEQLAQEVKKTGMDPDEARRLAQALQQAAQAGRRITQAANQSFSGSGRGSPPPPGDVARRGGAAGQPQTASAGGGPPPCGHPQCGGGG
jgi:hypothetical protein